MSLIFVRGKAKRVCLKCGRKFNSLSPSNRICVSCGQINKALAVPERVIIAQRGVKRHRGELLDVGT